MTIKNLTVRLDPETREKLSLVADREVRPMANQIVVFVRQGIENYLRENGLEFSSTVEQLDNGEFKVAGLILHEVERSSNTEEQPKQ